jgi:hypothetical protein
MSVDRPLSRLLLGPGERRGNRALRPGSSGPPANDRPLAPREPTRRGPAAVYFCPGTVHAAVGRDERAARPRCGSRALHSFIHSFTTPTQHGGGGRSGRHAGTQARKRQARARQERGSPPIATSNTTFLEIAAMGQSVPPCQKIASISTVVDRPRPGTCMTRDHPSARVARRNSEFMRRVLAISCAFYGIRIRVLRQTMTRRAALSLPRRLPTVPMRPFRRQKAQNAHSSSHAR